MSKGHDTREISELMSIANSPALKRILAEHKAYLQNVVNRFVKEKDVVEAYAVLSKMNDIDNILDLVNLKISKLDKDSG